MKPNDIESLQAFTHARPIRAWVLPMAAAALILLALNLLMLPLLHDMVQDRSAVRLDDLGSLALVNLAALACFLAIHVYVIKPLVFIAQHLQIVREAYLTDRQSIRIPLSISAIAREVARFSHFALDYYRKHQEVSDELVSARKIIGQFAVHQNTMLGSTSREIGTQYRSVLAYANHLEEQIVKNKLDPGLRFDFDEVCESSFNLKLIAGALAMLSDESPPHMTTVTLPSVMQRTMLALAPALDRRSMKLTTAEVDAGVAAHGDPGYLAHILWMMLLGMIRFAADESTLRLRCLNNHDGSLALLSIVVSELSPQHTSDAQAVDPLTRQLQNLTPHMFAETIRIHGNIQLADMLTKRMGGSISVLPLTTSSCEICMTLPAAVALSMAA